MIDYEDLRLKIVDGIDTYTLVDLLELSTEDILDEFKDRVLEHIEDIYSELSLEEFSEEEDGDSEL